MLAFKQRANLSAEELAKLGTAQENLATTTDGITNNMIDANEQMLKTAQALDELALQTTLPLAAKGIQVFTEGMMKATEYMLSFSGMSAEEIAAKLETDATKAATGKDEIDWSKAAGDAITMGLGGAALGAAVGGPIGAAVGLALGTAFGGLTSIFGGERAVGGPVEAGKLYKIGERGVEAFVPNMSGTILPNDQLSQMSDAANTRSNMVMPNDQLSQMSDAAMPKDGMVMPNDQLTKMSNIAGPASSYNSADYGSAVSANLPERTQPAEQPTTNTAGTPDNALMEASINRLDQLVSAMSRNNDINTKILQAANR